MITEEHDPAASATALTRLVPLTSEACESNSRHSSALLKPTCRRPSGLQHRLS